jgi:hypothetical protein
MVWLAGPLELAILCGADASASMIQLALKIFYL